MSYTYKVANKLAAMAQMVERVLGKDEVTGSIPVSSSMKKHLQKASAFSFICVCTECSGKIGSFTPIKRSAYTFNSFLQLKSIPNAPRGALIKIPSTATERTILPQESPKLSGTEPMAA